MKVKLVHGGGGGDEKVGRESFFTSGVGLLCYRAREESSHDGTSGVGLLCYRARGESSHD